jgi:CRISPR/Cas system CMR-associated protein Cmr5 small subunit
MNEDPIVQEVRKARDQHAASFGYDSKKILEDIQQSQKKYGSRLVRRAPKLLLKATGS